jgi:hypothetical protein
VVQTSRVAVPAEFVAVIRTPTASVPPPEGFGRVNDVPVEEPGPLPQPLLVPPAPKSHVPAAEDDVLVFHWYVSVGVGVPFQVLDETVTTSPSSQFGVQPPRLPPLTYTGGLVAGAADSNVRQNATETGDPGSVFDPVTITFMASRMLFDGMSGSGWLEPEPAWSTQPPPSLAVVHVFAALPVELYHHW